MLVSIASNGAWHAWPSLFVWTRNPGLGLWACIPKLLAVSGPPGEVLLGQGEGAYLLGHCV